MIKSRDGQQQTVSTTSNTTVTKTEASSLSAVTEGQTVTVVGTKAADGILTATTVSEGEAGLRGFGGRSSTGTTGAPTP